MLGLIGVRALFSKTLAGILTLRGLTRRLWHISLLGLHKNSWIKSRYSLNRNISVVITREA